MHVRACFVEYFKIISSMNYFSFNVNIVDLKKDLFMKYHCHFKTTLTINEQIREDPNETEIKLCPKRVKSEQSVSCKTRFV